LGDRGDVDAMDIDCGAGFGLLDAETWRTTTLFFRGFHDAKRNIPGTLFSWMGAHADDDKEDFAIHDHRRNIESGIGLLFESRVKRLRR
jgi:hypothetical protein